MGLELTAQTFEFVLAQVQSHMLYSRDEESYAPPNFPFSFFTFHLGLLTLEPQGLERLKWLNKASLGN